MGSPQLHFHLAIPVAHKKGTIWKEKVRSLKIYMVMNCQGLIGWGHAGGRREELRGSSEGGGCAVTYLAVRWAIVTGLLPSMAALAVSVP